RLVDDRVERDDAADKIAPNRLDARKFGSSAHQRSGEAAGDLGQETGEQSGQTAPRATQVGPRQNDAGADDPDRDLAGAANSEHESLSVRPAGRAELVVGDNRGGIAGE